MRLMKQDTAFIWDEATQQYFEALKKALLLASFLSPLDYTKDFILYMDASHSMVGVVLVQEDDKLQDLVIYYLSRTLTRPELRYLHIKKLSLEEVYVVHRLHHYKLLKTTTMVVDVNQFQYVLS